MKYLLFMFGIAAIILTGCKSSSLSTKTNESQGMNETTKPDTISVAVIKTNMGTIEIKLEPEYAPKAVENFTGLAEKGYYDGIIFHRIIPGFMIQGGDPTGTGRGGQSIWGKNFNDEIVPKLKFDEPGILAMANAGPNTNGSQFFITVAPATWLNGNYTIFGNVINGMDAVYNISKVATNKANDRPLKDVVMEKVTIENRVVNESAQDKPKE